MVVLNAFQMRVLVDICRRACVPHVRSSRIGLFVLLSAAIVACGCSTRVLTLESACENGTAPWQETGFVNAGSDAWVRIAEAHKEGGSRDISEHDHTLELILRLSESSGSGSQEPIGYVVWGVGHHIVLEISESRVDVRREGNSLHLQGTVMVRESAGRARSPVLCEGVCRLVLSGVWVAENPVFACGIWGKGYSGLSSTVANLEPQTCVGREDLWEKTFGEASHASEAGAAR